MHTPTPGLPEFDYIKPASLAEASRFLAEHQGEARPFMGGTDTFVRMRDGFWQEKYVVDVKNLDGMSNITFDPASGLTIGASVTRPARRSLDATLPWIRTLRPAPTHTLRQAATDRWLSRVSVGAEARYAGCSARRESAPR